MADFDSTTARGITKIINTSLTLHSVPAGELCQHPGVISDIDGQVETCGPLPAVMRLQWKGQEPGIPLCRWCALEEFDAWEAENLPPWSESYHIDNFADDVDRSHHHLCHDCQLEIHGKVCRWDGFVFCWDCAMRRHRDDIQYNRYFSF